MSIHETDHGATIGGGEVCCVCVSVSLCVMYESYACEPGGAL